MEGRNKTMNGGMIAKGTGSNGAKSSINGFGSGQAGGSMCCKAGDKIVGKKPGAPIAGFSGGEKSGKA